MKNKTLTKNMPNVKWKAIPPVRGPNPQGVNYGNVHRNNKQVVTRKKVSNENLGENYFSFKSVSGLVSSFDSFISSSGVILIKVL